MDKNSIIDQQKQDIKGWYSKQEEEAAKDFNAGIMSQILGGGPYTYKETKVTHESMLDIFGNCKKQAI